MTAEAMPQPEDQQEAERNCLGEKKNQQAAVSESRSVSDRIIKNSIKNPTATEIQPVSAQSLGPRAEEGTRRADFSVFHCWFGPSSLGVDLFWKY